MFFIFISIIIYMNSNNIILKNGEIIIGSDSLSFDEDHKFKINDIEITENEINFGTNKRIHFDSDNNLNINGSASGLKGSQGHQGSTGGTGSQGHQGSTGGTGSQGHQGSTGGTGSQGHQGNTGDTGSQGHQGNTGDTGSQGHAGISNSILIDLQHSNNIDLGNVVLTTIDDVNNNTTYVQTGDVGMNTHSDVPNTTNIAVFGTSTDNRKITTNHKVYLINLLKLVFI